MDRDELAAFRAKHPSVVDAINNCDRPDWALQLAFEATDDRKAVIRYAANLVPGLTEEGDVASLITPYPSVRESIDVYADNEDRVSVVHAHARALILGTCLGASLSFVFNRYVWVEALGHRSVDRFALLITVPLMIALVRVSFAWIVRRRAARFDDESAFATIIDMVTRAADKHPERVPKRMKFLRRKLVNLFEGPQPP